MTEFMRIHILIKHSCQILFPKKLILIIDKMVNVNNKWRRIDKLIIINKYILAKLYRMELIKNEVITSTMHLRLISILSLCIIKMKIVIIMLNVIM